MSLRLMIPIYVALIIVGGGISSAQETQRSRASIKTSASKGRGSVAIHAAIIYKLGGVQPVARNTFYLLDEDLEKILRDAGLSPTNQLSLVSSYGLAAIYPELHKEFITKAREAIKGHVIQSVMTDFNGKAQFHSVAPGSYYLFGLTQTRGGFAIWNLKTDVKIGRKSLILDQNNAAAAL